MALSKTTIKAIQQEVEREVLQLINKHGFSKAKAITHVIKGYKGAIKNPPKWSKAKKATYIAEYKKGIAHANKLKKPPLYK